MKVDILDKMIASATQTFAQGDPINMAQFVTSLATRWPNEPALAICFAITTAAADLETLLSDQDRLVTAAYRTAALIAADILAIEAMGQQPATAHHLLHFWRRAGPDYLIR